MTTVGVNIFLEIKKLYNALLIGCKYIDTLCMYQITKWAVNKKTGKFPAKWEKPKSLTVIPTLKECYTMSEAFDPSCK